MTDQQTPSAKKIAKALWTIAEVVAFISLYFSAFYCWYLFLPNVERQPEVPSTFFAGIMVGAGTLLFMQVAFYAIGRAVKKSITLLRQ